MELREESRDRKYMRETGYGAGVKSERTGNSIKRLDLAFLGMLTYNRAMLEGQ